MRGHDGVLGILDMAIAESARTGYQAEVRWQGSRDSTMRSGWGEVNQASYADPEVLVIELRDGRRAACVSLSEFSRSAIIEAIKHCAELVPFAPENKYMPDLVEPSDTYPEKTLGLQTLREFEAEGVELQTKALSLANAEAKSRGFKPSARIFTNTVEVGVGNSLGLLRYHTFGCSSFALVINLDHGYSSYAERASKTPGDLDFAAVVEEAIDRAALIQRLPKLDPFRDGRGERKFDTVFNRYAAADLLFWTSFAFHSLNVYEEESYFSGKNFGETVAATEFSLRDDWRDPGVLGFPFDLSGRTRDRIDLVEAGKFRGLLFDPMTAKKMATEPTGHSDFTPSLAISGGSTGMEEMRTAGGRLLEVTYFNYPSIPDSRESVFTATTRHGTFVIEDGVEKYATPPLRLTDKSFRMLSRIIAMGRPELTVDRENYEMFYPWSLLVPPMFIGNVRYVGSNLDL